MTRKVQGCVPIKLDLWKLKFEFLIIFICHKNILFTFFLSFKKLSTSLILSLWALQKQEVDQIWLAGHSCQAHALQRLNFLET